MSQIELPEGERPHGYAIIPWFKREQLVHYHTFGSYQGEWLMLTKNEKEYLIYKDYFGSCSGCDAYEGAILETPEDVKRFVDGYKSFIEIPITTMRNLVTNSTLDKLFPANKRDRYSELKPEEFVADAQIAVKVLEDIEVTAQDILACVNQEIKQRALRKFGYEKFVEEAHFETLHEDRDAVLLGKKDIVFVYVKDSSTARRYLLRVPPHMKTVREAIAWTFNLPMEAYKPLIET